MNDIIINPEDKLKLVDEVVTSKITNLEDRILSHKITNLEGKIEKLETNLEGRVDSLEYDVTFIEPWFLGGKIERLESRIIELEKLTTELLDYNTNLKRSHYELVKRVDELFDLTNKPQQSKYTERPIRRTYKKDTINWDSLLDAARNTNVFDFIDQVHNTDFDSVTENQYSVLQKIASNLKVEQFSLAN